MGSERKSRQREEKERLEALQNTEKRFLNGTYGDFFGQRDGDGGGQPGTLSFGAPEEDGGPAGRAESRLEELEAKGRKVASGLSSKASDLSARADALLKKHLGESRQGGGRAGKQEGHRRPQADLPAGKQGGKASSQGGSLSGGTEGGTSGADDLARRQEEMSAALGDREDALRRANDALREVQSLLDNPLYDGMPSLTGRDGSGPAGAGPGAAGSGAGTGKGSGTDASGEIDPGLMAGSGGDLFTGLAGSGRPDGSPADPLELSAGTQGQAQQSTAQQAAAAEVQKEPEKDPMEELDSLIGLTSIKHDVKELTDFVKIQKLRRDGGLKSVPVSLHLVFTGNPGTGKTTVARILAKLYKQIGVLSKGQLVEVDRSGLVAGYVGQTALKTAQKIEEARGGVLFIDEAYALARKDDTFGQEAIDTILKAMEDSREDFIVIVAGYTGPMENFINSNPGLKSRFNKYIEFPDYTIDELMGIFEMNCRKYDYEASDEVKAHIREMIVQRKLVTQENFANAREVRNFFEEIITNQARRVAAMEAPTQDDMKQLLTEDLTETAEEDAARTLEKAEKMGALAE